MNYVTYEAKTGMSGNCVEVFANGKSVAVFADDKTYRVFTSGIKGLDRLIENDKRMIGPMEWVVEEDESQGYLDAAISNLSQIVGASVTLAFAKDNDDEVANNPTIKHWKY